MGIAKPKVVVSASGAEFTIETGIPLPSLGRPPGSGRKSIYPFMLLEIGDSFFFACDKRKHKTVMACAHASGKRYGRKYAGRAVADGVRVWRIA